MPEFPVCIATVHDFTAAPDKVKSSITAALYSLLLLWQVSGMEKDFTGWHRCKAALDALSHAPTFQQREIWWCSVGINIGHEVDGKNRLFNRPVLIVRKFNQHIFLGVPLTTKIKQNRYYQPIHFRGQQQCVMLSQLRLWEGKRLTHKLGKLSGEQFESVRKALKDLI